VDVGVKVGVIKLYFRGEGSEDGSALERPQAEEVAEGVQPPAGLADVLRGNYPAVFPTLWLGGMDATQVAQPPFNVALLDEEAAVAGVGVARDGSADTFYGAMEPPIEDA